jgi:hypothetical protein
MRETIFEDALRQDIINLYDSLSKPEFVEKYNKLFNTNLTIDNIIWGETRGGERQD